jgi:hypothetical protein
MLEGPTFGGVTVCRTDTVDVPVVPIGVVAVICAVPEERATTRPSVVTVATAVLLEVQLTGSADAESRTLSPTFISTLAGATEGGVEEMIKNLVESARPSVVPTIHAAPSARPLTSPSLVTDATRGPVEFHDVFCIRRPLARLSERSCRVEPTAKYSGVADVIEGAETPSAADDQAPPGSVLGTASPLQAVRVAKSKANMEFVRVRVIVFPAGE